MTCDVSGYYPVCDHLLPMQPRGLYPGTRNQRWHVQSHPAKGDDTGGKECEGVKVAL